MIPPRNILCVLLSVLCFSNGVQSQSNTINVHHLTTTDGLADGVIRAIGQDKYGYIWISSLSGLSRYDGYSVKVYHNKPGDSTSYPIGVAWAIWGDRKGNLWFGFDRGLYRFNHVNEHFERVPGSAKYRVFVITEINNGEIYLLTSQGLARFNSETQVITPLKDKVSLGKELLDLPVNDFGWCNDELYLATDTGIVIYNTKTNAVCLKQVPSIDSKIGIIAVDASGTVWGAFGNGAGKLVKTDTSFTRATVYPGTIFPDTLNQTSIVSLYIDKEQRLWITTGGKGLLKYDKAGDRFIHYQDDIRRPNALATAHYKIPFHGRDGFLWLASEGNGVDYFDPDNNLFEVISPYEQQYSSLLTWWARTMLEEKSGSIWMGWGGGLVRKEANNRVTYWRNTNGKAKQLHSNSIRSLLEDENGNILVGTSDGVNRYNQKTGSMEFLDIKDSLPNHFYWTMYRDSRGTIWFGSNRTLFYWNKGDKTAHRVASHPDLSKIKIGGVQCIFEDSKKQMWFGSHTWGVYRYNPSTGKVTLWYRSEANDSTMVGLNPTSITEDKNGVIWIAFTTGLTSYDPATNKFKQYSREQGMTSVKTSALRVDERNRLWIGSTSGLLVLDSSRKNFKTFDIADGLPTLEFNDQSSYLLSDGRFAYPSLKGFVLFDPMAYSETSSIVNPFLSGINVFGKRFPTSVNPEELQSVSLRPDENFFSFDLVALSFNNPGQTWFAYQLEGLDKTWTYTRNRVVTYTNVPGGSYVFRYKASADPNIWTGAEKSLLVNVKRRFYRTTWFWVVFSLGVLGILYFIYRSRLAQQQRMFVLKSKAQLLEKEKALVQYESLKQQLNPHFLFNSLTSLGSLIRVDQRGAGDFLDRMSKIYRYILKSRDSETVTLADELKFVEMYIELQKTRFDNSLVIENTIGEEWMHRRIAPVTLQNLVENAIKHNVVDKESPLVIEFFVEDGWLIVRNNLQKKKFVETSNKQGLANMESLYSYLSSKPLKIEESEEYFIVKIPLI